MAEATPWARWLVVGQRAGMAPDAFWRLSLKEWRALVAPAHEALPRAAFDSLARRFPDEER